MKTIIETDRLIIRELLPSDAQGIFTLDSDPEVHQYLGNKPITTIEQASEVIEFIRKQYVDNGIGRWAMVDKKSNEFVGWTGFKWITDLTNNHQNYYDIGYRLVKKYWGQGLATESAVACLQYVFEKLNAKDVYAMADCDNEASNHILKKIGLNFIESFDLDKTLHNWYRIERHEYLKNNQTK